MPQWVRLSELLGSAFAAVAGIDLPDLTLLVLALQGAPYLIGQEALCVQPPERCE